MSRIVKVDDMTDKKKLMTLQKEINKLKRDARSLQSKNAIVRNPHQVRSKIAGLKKFRNAPNTYLGQKVRSKMGTPKRRLGNNAPVNIPVRPQRQDRDRVNNKMYPKKDYLTPSAYKLQPTNLPMEEVLAINPPINVGTFTDMVFTPALISQAMGIGTGDTIDVNNQPIGLTYMFAMSLAYDLWLATFGEYSRFKKAARWYWDLRSALMPTRRGKVSFKFVAAQTFFGSDGMYPNGFPLDRTGASISWYSNKNSPNYIINSNIPVVTEEVLDAQCADIVNMVMKDMERLSDACKLIDDPSDNNAFRQAIGAFYAFVADEDELSPLDRWGSFFCEVPASAEEKWLMYLGLANQYTIDSDGNTSLRAGQFIVNDFQSACNLGHRILHGHHGWTKEVHHRVKTIAYEDVLWQCVATLVQGDIHYNDMGGTNDINNSTWARSVLYNLPPQYLVILLAAVQRRVQLTNAAFFDNPQSGMTVWAGLKFYAGPNETLGLLPSNVAECIADLVPVMQDTKRIGDILNTAVYGSLGNFGVSPYNSPNGNQYDLTDLVTRFYPTAPAISYNLKNDPGINMPDYVDTDDLTLANFVGSGVPDAELSLKEIFVALTGNIDSQPGSAHNNNCTLMYYTKIYSIDEGNKAKRFGESFDKRKRLSISNDKEDKKISKDLSPRIGNWTPLAYANVVTTINKYPFTNDEVAYDLTRLMCFTTVPKSQYCGIFHENYSMKQATGELRYVGDIDIDSGKCFAHPIATRGGVEQSDNIGGMRQKIQGGGFDLISNLFDIGKSLLFG